jgi:hypothetical protein
MPNRNNELAGFTAFFQSQLENVRFTSTHYNQNLSNTFATPVGATRAQCFLQNDIQYLVYASFSTLTIYNISSIRSNQLITTIPLGLPASTMYDFKTIKYRGNQYFFIAALGFIFGFILLPDFTGIVPVGLYGAAQAFAQIEPWVYQDNLFFVASTYSSCRLYKFSVSPSITFQQFVILDPGKIPGMLPIVENNLNNKVYILSSTTNFLTNTDLLYAFERSNTTIFLLWKHSSCKWICSAFNERYKSELHNSLLSIHQFLGRTQWVLTLLLH